MTWATKESKTRCFNRRYIRERDRCVAYLGGKCSKCGSVEKLEIHHKDKSQKSFNPTSKSDMSWKRRVEELNKCEILCMWCHKAAHGRVARHGAEGMYALGCKCELCLEHRRVKSRQFRANGGDELRKKAAAYMRERRARKNGLFTCPS